MQLALRGLGAVSPTGALYVDTGGGITPENFEATCCTSWLFGAVESFDHDGAGDACDAFYQANAGQFGGNRPCSSAGLLNFTETPVIKAPVVPMRPPPIVTDRLSQTYGQAMVPRVACPPEISPCPCDGRLVVTAQDGTDLLTCQAIQNQIAQNAAIAAGMKQASEGFCTEQAAKCRAGLFGSFLSSTTDCTGCTVDFNKPAVWLAPGITVAALLFFTRR